MPGDPKEYRLKLLRCAELAASARTSQLKMTLLTLSKTWEKLAIEREQTRRLLDESQVDFKRTG